MANTIESKKALVSSEPAGRTMSWAAALRGKVTSRGLQNQAHVVFQLTFFRVLCAFNLLARLLYIRTTYFFVRYWKKKTGKRGSKEAKAGSVDDVPNARPGSEDRGGGNNVA
jgi:hypothetical protein